MKDIMGYENLYAVREDGRVYSYRRQYFSGIGNGSLKWTGGEWLKDPRQFGKPARNAHLVWRLRK